MTKTKKPIFILMFAVLSAIMLVGAKFTSAKAAEKLIVPSDAKIELTDGVSIKLNYDGGMRFVAKMNEAAKNYVCDNEVVSLVALIAPDYIIGNGEDYATLKDKCVKIVANKDNIYAVDGSYYANFCVVKNEIVQHSPRLHGGRVRSRRRNGCRKNGSQVGERQQLL